MNHSKTLITGASGFVGGRLAEMLFLNDLTHVRAGIRNWARAARLSRFPMDVVLCDIMQPQQVEEAMRGMTTVVHCAYTDDRDVIVEGTRHVLETAVRQKVERVVFLSTAEVYGPSASGEIDETVAMQQSGGIYADAKIEAEELCRSYIERGLPVSVLRPSIVYGPFSGRLMKFSQRLQSGQWRTYEGFGEGLCNLIYVDDLARAIWAAVERPEAVGEVFNVNGPDVVTWNEFFNQFNGALDLPHLATVSSSQSAMKSAVRDRVNSLTGFFLSRYREPLMSIYMRGGRVSQMMKDVKQALFNTPSVQELETLYSRKAKYIDVKARSLLDYQPEVSVEQGMHLCALWLALHDQIVRPERQPVYLDN